MRYNTMKMTIMEIVLSAANVSNIGSGTFRYIVAITTIASEHLLLGGVGYAVDCWAMSSPWGLVTGLLAGVLTGFANLIATVRR
jgi:hypothetical protein